MSISRRKFVKTATVVAISAGIPIKVLANDLPIAKSTQPVPSSSASGGPLLDSELFAKYVNTPFTLKRGRSETKLILMKVHHWTAPGSKKSVDGKECFSLVFDHIAGVEGLTQDTYTAVHSALGEFPLFIVPAGRSRKKYEALFNRTHG
jgi:hypothetical protein